MDFLNSNMEIISVIGYAVVNILNATTKHWSEAKGLMKVVSFFTEIFSVVTSVNTVNGQFGKLKLPGQIAKKK